MSKKIGCHSCCDSYIKYKSELNDAKKVSLNAKITKHIKTVK